MRPIRTGITRVDFNTDTVSITRVSFPPPAPKGNEPPSELPRRVRTYTPSDHCRQALLKVLTAIGRRQRLYYSISPESYTVAATQEELED